MALVEEDLPGVSKGEWRRSYVAFDSFCFCFFIVRTDFQLREDQGFAHRLQEQECECHLASLGAV